MKPTRASYIPDGAQARDYQDVRAVVYLYETSGQPAAIAFSDKSQKPRFWLRFRDAERREQYIAQWVARLSEIVARKREVQEKRKAFQPSLQIGDVLRCSWGYEQTNIDYFQVTEARGAYVTIRKIAADSEDTLYMQGNCVPRVGAFIGEPMRKRVQEGNRVKIYSHANAYKVEPKEVAPGVKVYGVDRWTAYA
jgi:hypothetical protein